MCTRFMRFIVTSSLPPRWSSGPTLRPKYQHSVAVSVSTRTPSTALRTRRSFSQNMALAAKSSNPRPSASVIVVNPQNEILLVHRNPNSKSFAGAHVFPGGNYDECQDDSPEMTAIRELFEETGLLLASSSSGCFPRGEELDRAREEIHAQRRMFREFLSKSSLTADVSSLLPFTQWITPPIVPRRFHTHFYVAFLDSTPSAGFTSGGKQERLPTPDGGQEVIAARFVHPSKALKQGQAHEITLMPPQVYLLTTLADLLQGDKNTATQREQVRVLSQGAFGRMEVHPRALPEKDAEGRTILTYEGDETRGGPKGRLHRSLVKFGKGGVATDVTIQRNFDIFSDGAIWSDSSKL